jgi:hypothetical protein
MLPTFMKSVQAEDVKPFEKIPGPVRLPFLGNLYMYNGLGFGMHETT